ncbi:MAG TPA: ABC transporter permease [Kiloniellales bacterium]|jgi:simple sugar transport system permease protein
MLGLLRAAYLLKGVWAILAALVAGSGLIWLGGSDPIEAYSALFSGAFLEYHGFATTLVKMSPILLAGLAVALPLRAGLFNIGAEGQIYLGALFATWAALYLPEMPGWIHIIICSIAGAIGGGLWALLPGYLKAYHGINEVIVTLLMNYIGINLVSYFVSGPMLADGAPYPYSNEIRDSLWLPHILPGTDAHFGVVIGIVLAIVLFVMFRRTSLGFSMATVGHNPDAARYAGISVKRYVMMTLAFGGALAGLAGAYEVLGLKYRLFHMFSAGYGFDGIVVALLAEANPLLVTIAALFLAGLRSGANIMQRAVGVPTTVVEAIQGLVIIFVAASIAFRFEKSTLVGIVRRRKAIAAALAGENMKRSESDGGRGP